MSKHVAAAVFCFLALPAVQAQPLQSEGPRQAPSLTIYQDDLALVREQRSVELPKGRSELVIGQISQQILAESVTVKSSGVEVTSINYLSANLNVDSLVERHIGRPVTLIYHAPAAGDGDRVQGILLGGSGDRPLVRVGDRIEIGGPDAPWRLAFDAVPADLRGQDALVVELESAGAGRRALELAYLTRGLSWQADYVLELDAEESGQGRLSAWATLDNRTGLTVQGAQVRLVAGSPNQVRTPAPAYATRALKAEAADMAQEAVGDYRLYTVPDPVVLQGQQRKQVRLLAPRAVKTVRRYEIEGYALGTQQEPREQAARVILTLRNEAPALGQPLPAGLLRVYAPDSRKELQFLGEDRMPQSVAGQALELRLGSASEVSGKRTALSARRIDQNTTEVEWAVELRNGKRQPVTVEVVEQLPGDWQILSESHRHQRKTAQQARWSLEVPAGGTAELRYRAQVRL